jgi:hypothetical protein
MHFTALFASALFVLTALAAPIPDPAPVAQAGNIGDFGSCSVPEIEFGVGFDGRKETSFQPADKRM